MARYPKKSDIELWIPQALYIFKSIMPPINVPYPSVYITTARTFEPIRRQLAEDLVCHNKEIPDDSTMEYVHGDEGGAIVIRQNLLPDKNGEHFCTMFWHELGHFYAINTEVTDLRHYSDPGLVDDSQILEFAQPTINNNPFQDTRSIPVVGWSDERKRQEGYWFWQEFVAECISKYVSYKHRSSLDTYHPELIDWHPDIWSPIISRFEWLLDEAFGQYPNTIDEYCLAHYFADLLMDDFITLYVKAAEENKLRVYDGNKVVYPDAKIEPSCIDEVEHCMQKPLWNLKKMLETQVKKERFWETDKEILLKIGDCIGELTLAKIIALAQEI